MTKIVYIEPSTFVDWMTEPGVAVDDYHVPVKRYMSANPQFGSNDAANAVLGPLQKVKGDDGVPVVRLTKNYGRLMTGQGYYYDFLLVMQFIADNLDKVWQIKAAQKYFPAGSRPSAGGGLPPGTARTVLDKMVADKVFGMDCIGFISQFLVSAGVWDAYKTYYPKDYFREFKPIASLDDVRPLTLLIWGDHIAIVDKVHGRATSPAWGEHVTVDVCQSSDGTNKEGTGVSGPQRNQRAILARARDGSGRPLESEGRALFSVRHRGHPVMPVHKNCWLANYRIEPLVSAGDYFGF